jgi:predicted permease
MQLVAARLFGRLVLPGASPQRAAARSTLAFLCSSFAPGLSAFVFIKEFAPSGTAMGALMDLASKGYLLVLAPSLMRAAYADALPAKKAGGASAPPASLGAIVRRELAEPLNLAIVCGLLMSALGLGLKELEFVGDAISRLEGAQTSALFLFIGLTISLDGDAPVVCGATSLARAAVGQLFAFGAVAALGLEGDVALTIVFMCQSACSVVCFAQIEKVANTISAAGGDGESACALPLALDLVGYSFPLSIALNASAGLLREAYVERMPLIAGGMLLAAAAIVFSSGGKKPPSDEAAARKRA